MDVRQIVQETILAVAAENHKPRVPLDDDMRLMDTGLDSLCLAVIVARLEDHLGTDPFRMADEMPFPTTVGEFIAFYANAPA